MRRHRIAAVVGLLLVAVGAWLLLRPGSADAGSLEASGTVEATEADLGFQAGGRIASVEAREGDEVEAGRVLARLDAAEVEARREAAEAQIAAARALLREMREGARPEEVEQARAAAGAARERMEEAARVAERSRRLFEGGAVSREQYEQARTAHEVARAQARQASEQLALVTSGTRAERIEAQAAAVAQAEAQLAGIDAALESAVVRAPFAGVVTLRHREPGEAVSPGAPVLTLLDPGERWVRIFVREDQVGRVFLGQAASIRSDSHPEKRYRGQVAHIASEAEFTPRNVQTAEERVKLVYAVRVRITGDPAGELKPGVPADVALEAPGR